MTDEQWRRLQKGDLIQHKLTGESYVITRPADVGGGYTGFIAVRALQVTQPDEWIQVPAEENTDGGTERKH